VAKSANNQQIKKEEEVKTITTTKIENDNNPSRWRSIEHAITKWQLLLNRVRAVGLLAVMLLVPVGQAAQAQGKSNEDSLPPIVFQTAGPTANSIQSTVDGFRAALGNPNNGNNPPRVDRSGHREINWDGVGAPTTTTPPVNPFNAFLNTRGAQFTTPGIGLSQATPSGLAVLFNNPTYSTIFSTFSPFRLFTPVGSSVTEALFFVPGSNGAIPATVRGFGAVFTDVDQPDGSGPGKKRGNRGASTLMEYFDADGKLLFSSFVPASPGDGSLSFFGVVFEDALIAGVRITTGDVAPGPDDDGESDIVMMDDFIYGEPQPLR
jgi:hypothetical protein